MNRKMIFEIAEAVDKECGQENGPGSEWLTMFSEKMNPWKPIATAPRDGTEVLVLLDCAGVAVSHIAWYRSREEWESSGQYCGGWSSLEEWEGWWSYTLNSVSQEKLEGLRFPTHWTNKPADPVTIKFANQN